jgi:ABC-2 type transport system ATP-binding protein
MSLMPSPIIELEHVTKRFGNLKAVNDISLSVNRGEIFAFLGPNGAGKSTTIKMLTTLLRPTEGKLLLNGHDVTTDQDAARKSFGIVFQDSSVDTELTAYENMELHAVLYGMPMREVGPRVHELLELLELEDRATDYVKTFSGGMIRRLEIARGLLHQPHILFLDEPTLGLDTQTRNLLWSYVTKLNKQQKMTVFLTTHYLEEAEMVADRIAFIDHGSIIAVGTDAELKAKTKTNSLEQAYLALTGKEIRDEKADASDQFRARVRSRQRR